MGKHKKIINIVLFLAAIVLGICIGIRLGKIAFVNEIYAENMMYTDDSKQARYVLYKNGYVLRYSKATFLNSSCFLSVSSEDDEKMYLAEDGTVITDGLMITLYIWPLERKMGIYFYQQDGEEIINEQVYVDDNLECISEDLNYKTHMDKLIKENEEEIRALLWEALRI